MTRKEVNALISMAVKGSGVPRGWAFEVEAGGSVVPSGIWQGEEAEGKPWEGHQMPMAEARKLAQPGDLLIIALFSQHFGDFNLEDHLYIQLPDPEAGIEGWYHRIGRAKKPLGL